MLNPKTEFVGRELVGRNDVERHVLALDTCAVLSVINAHFDHGIQLPDSDILSGGSQAQTFINIVDSYLAKGNLIIPTFAQIECQANRETCHSNVLESIGEWERSIVDLSLQSEIYTEAFNGDPLFNVLDGIAQCYRTCLLGFRESRIKRTEEILTQQWQIIENWLENSRCHETRSAEEVEKLNNEAEDRYAREIPPGYSDRKKNEGWPEKYQPDLAYHRKYGDYYVWKEFLDIMVTLRPTSAIFVTADMKVDWWSTITSDDGKEKGSTSRPAISDGKIEVSKPKLVARRELDQEVRGLLSNCDFQLMSPRMLISESSSKL